MITILALIGILLVVIYTIVQIVKGRRAARTKKIVDKTMQKIQNDRDRLVADILKKSNERNRNKNK